jgi:hypothetical protein
MAYHARHEEGLSRARLESKWNRESQGTVILIAAERLLFVSLASAAALSASVKAMM